MKYFLTIFVIAIVFAMSFTSCENDAPEINYSHTVTNVSDFKGLIDAINDQSKTMAEKLDMIKEAMGNQALTIAEKIGLLTLAVEKGIATQKEMAELLIQTIEDVITSQTATLAEKMEAIKSAINSQTLTLSQKMDLLNTTVERGFATQAELQGAYNDAFIVAMEAMLKNMEQMQENDTENAELLAAAIIAMKNDVGIYRSADDGVGVYLSEYVWQLILNDAVLYSAFQKTLTATQPIVTTSQNSEHSCLIPIDLKNFEAPELFISEDRPAEVKDVPYGMIRIVNVFSKATYTIDKDGCGLGIYETYITDIRGERVERYNFNGGANGEVELIFVANNIAKLTGNHVEINMR